jgi:PPK2 family polyphosphate:nucleotide phosphotransferase
MELSWSALERFRVQPGSKVRLRDRDTRWRLPEDLRELDKDELKDEAAEMVARRARDIAALQDVLWADGRFAVLILFQGMDTAGKDGTIKHVTSGMNPAGVRVTSFKAPSDEELRHHYLWRYTRATPEHGTIGIFNRSHYEDVAVVRVFPELLKTGIHWDDVPDERFWKERYQDINALEQVLTRGGTVVVKFFLHLSKEEQRQRLLARLKDPHKRWKFNPRDVVTRGRWDDYQRAYEEAITHTSTEAAPWWVIPADSKWVMRAIVADIIADTVHKLPLDYPPIDADRMAELQQALETLTYKVK